MGIGRSAPQWESRNHLLSRRLITLDSHPLPKLLQSTSREQGLLFLPLRLVSGVVILVATGTWGATRPTLSDRKLPLARHPVVLTSLSVPFWRCNTVVGGFEGSSDQPIGKWLRSRESRGPTVQVRFAGALGWYTYLAREPLLSTRASIAVATGMRRWSS